MDEWVAKGEFSKLALSLLGGLVLIAGVTVGIYFLVKKSNK